MQPSVITTRATAAAIALALGAAGSMTGAARADDYYQGKLIRIVVGTPPGGGYDAYGRLVGRHLADYIPGKPTIIVQNMPGASGTKAASYLYGIAPKDGTVIATFNKSMPVSQALGEFEVPFKTEEMAWIGSLSTSPDIVTVWHTAGVKTIEEAKKREVVMGSDSPNGTMTTYPALLNATIGTKFRIVMGYAGSNAVNFAMEQGEVQGRGNNPWASWKTTKPHWVKDKLIVPLVQVTTEKDPDLPDVPTLIDLAQNDEQRTLFRFVSASSVIERPFAAPPGTPKEAVDILRKAFDQMVKDKDFLAEAAQQQMDLNPHTGAEVAKIVASIVATPPAIVQKVKEINSAAAGTAGGSKEKE
jgi:tripartite-type tricarboxylate transporter receptor subunit TctC